MQFVLVYVFYVCLLMPCRMISGELLVEYLAISLGSAKEGYADCV